MSETTKATDYIAYMGLAALSVCFGSAFFFNALTLDWLSPLGSGAGRMIIAAALLVPASLMAGPGLPKTLRLWFWVSALGIFGMLLPFLMAVWAQVYIPSNVAAGIFPSIPLLMLLFSQIFLKVTITRRKWIGLLIASVGLILLSGPGAVSQIGSKGSFLPQLTVFGACVLLAGAAIFVRIMPKAPPLQITAGALLVAAVASIPIAIHEIPLTKPPIKPLVGLIGVGVFSTGIGNLLRYNLIRRKGPVFITPNAYLSLLVAALLGVTLLGETLTTETLLSFGVILAGLFIALDGTGDMKRAG